MRISLLLVMFSIVTCSGFAQDTIDVVEKTIKISALSRETEYYGFAEGDKVIFNLIVENRKDIKDITVSEYPENVKFADHTTERVQNKVLNIPRNGIYVFEYYNSNISGRTINVKIQRIPGSAGTKYFNTNVKWVNIVDTVYTAREKTYLTSSDTTVAEVIDSKVRVHSLTNMGSSNKTIVDFILPANTIRWTYWIGVGEEGEKAFQKDEARFAASGIRLLNNINPLVGLAFGLIAMTHANIGENVKYYFLPTWEDVLKFKGDQPFMQFKNGNVVTDFGLMNLRTNKNEKYYIGLSNDNMIQGIDVNVKIIAIVVNNAYKSVVEKVPSYTNRLVPVHGE